MGRTLRWAGRWPGEATVTALRRRRATIEAPGAALAAGRWLGTGLAVAAFALGTGLALWMELGRRR